MITDQEDEIAAREKELEKREATINNLEEEVQDHEEYITEMEEAVDSLDVSATLLKEICAIFKGRYFVTLNFRNFGEFVYTESLNFFATFFYHIRIVFSIFVTKNMNIIGVAKISYHKVVELSK